MERTEEGVSELRDRATETIVTATEETARTKPGASGAVKGDPARGVRVWKGKDRLGVAGKYSETERQETPLCGKDVNL